MGERTQRKRWIEQCLPALCGALVLTGLASGCVRSAGPNVDDSTETGNPPVIDVAADGGSLGCGQRGGAGTCQLRDSGVSCTACLDRDVSWGYTGYAGFWGFGNGTLDGNRYTLSGCGELGVGTLGGLRCDTTLPQCVGDAVTLQDVLAALADPVVEAVLAGDSETFNRAPGTDEPYFNIMVGERTIFMGAECVADKPCNVPPPAIAALRELLDAIAAARACTPNECLLPFEAGNGNAPRLVYAYDTAAKVCVGRNYTGSGGNENRWDSREQCQASCPPPRGDPGCPPDRVYREDACVAPGTLGGCGQTSPACARVCSADADCAGDPIGRWCIRDACQEHSPL